MTAIIGAGVLPTTLTLFGYVLPRNGKSHPIAGSYWEPYIAIGFVAGAALGIGLIIVWTVGQLT